MRRPRFGAEPNRQACAIDLGLPGVLPVLNAEVLRMAVMFGLATGAEIATRSVFARKSYFYPDLPKGYQISQYDLPIVGRGSVEIELDEGSTKRIGITRAHLEEDAGKSVHDLFPGETGVDLNRAGVPLLEIVSEPDMCSAGEAIAYMRTIHSLVRYLGICDGNMEEGSFRCDANVSVRRAGDAALGTWTEIKNLNSFRFVGHAITGEVGRQIEILENGGAIVQETRLYDASADETRAMRRKEEANDYRYFPDPDLLPVELSPEYVECIRAELPELPAAKMKRFKSQYGLNEQDARRLTASPRHRRLLRGGSRRLGTAEARRQLDRRRPCGGVAPRRPGDHGQSGLGRAPRHNSSSASPTGPCPARWRRKYSRRSGAGKATRIP